MIYIKNTQTSEITAIEAKSHESVSKNFRKDPYELASSEEGSSHELEVKRSAKVYQCKSYLSSTDWYAIRLTDSGDVIPNEVATKRTNARSRQDQIEACTTLEQLNNINTDF